MTKNKKFIAICAVIVLLVGGWTIYDKHRKSAPAYSLSLIRTAVDLHDWDLFRTHVDTELIVSTTSNTLRQLLEEEKIPYYRSDLANVSQKSIDKELMQWVTNGGAIELGANDENASICRLMRAASLDDTAFKEIAYTKEEGAAAIVGVTLTDQKTGSDFVLELKMIPLPDDAWKIVELANIKDYRAEVRAARAEKLAAINEGIRAEMDGIVHVNGCKMELSPKDNFFGYSDSLLLSLFTTIHSEKPVAKVSGTFTVRYPDGSELRRPYEMPVNNLTEGDAELTLNRRFAHFNSEESTLSQLDDLSGCTLDLPIDKITFADGSAVEPKKEL